MDALVQARERLAAMAQPGRVEGKQGALQASREILQKSLLVASEVLHDAIEGLSRHRHKLAGRYDQIVRLLLSTASVAASRCASLEPGGADETHPPLFKRSRPV